jgi:diamine N-acetyltransferase
MQDVTLEELSPDNIDALLQVAVFDHQAGFIPSVASSIKLASSYEDATCMAVRAAGQVCGFALYGLDEETDCWKIYRLVIDKAFQGSGIGKRALELLLDILIMKRKAREVLIVYDDANKAAHHLYCAFGFRPYGTRGDTILSKLDADRMNFPEQRTS